MDDHIRYCDKNIEDVGSMLIITIFFGVAFASTSRGFFYYVLYSILMETIYAVSIKCRYTPQNTIKRLAIYSSGLFAFIITRIFICDDMDPFRSTYGEYPTMNNIYCGLTCQKPGKGNRMFGSRHRAITVPPIDTK